MIRRKAVTDEFRVRGNEGFQPEYLRPIRHDASMKVWTTK